MTKRCMTGMLEPRILRYAAAGTYNTGDMVACADGTDLVQPAATATDLRVLGALVLLGEYDSVVVANDRDRQFWIDSAKDGIGPFANSAGGDEITTADVDTICWVVDATTVAKTTGGGTRSPAGYVRYVDSEGGVYVDFTQYESLAVMRANGVIGGP